VENNCTHSFYVYPIKYDEHRTKLPRHIFRKAVLAEFPEPVGFESTALTEGYVKPLYLNPIYQRQIAIGRHGFPFNFNAGETYNYDKGICPVAERMYEKELLGVPIVREPLTTDDIDDLVHAIEKVLENATSIRAAFVDELEREEVLTPVDIANATHVR
jgi:dTDP-4-amino-4,6-dideoxygalactose transaminase